MNRLTLDNIIQLVNGIVMSHGFECIEAEWLASERTLRIYADTQKNTPSPARGIDLDGCAAVSRLLENCAELDQLIDGAYTLEVSSPGIERPLRQKTHFAEQLGKKIQVKLHGEDLPRRFGKGKLVAIDNLITIETAQGPWSFPLDKVQRASLVYEF